MNRKEFICNLKADVSVRCGGENTKPKYNFDLSAQKCIWELRLKNNRIVISSTQYAVSDSMRVGKLFRKEEIRLRFAWSLATVHSAIPSSANVATWTGGDARQSSAETKCIVLQEFSSFSSTFPLPFQLFGHLFHTLFSLDSIYIIDFTWTSWDTHKFRKDLPRILRWSIFRFIRTTPDRFG